MTKIYAILMNRKRNKILVGKGGTVWSQKERKPVKREGAHLFGGTFEKSFPLDEKNNIECREELERELKQELGMVNGIRLSQYLTTNPGLGCINSRILDKQQVYFYCCCLREDVLKSFVSEKIEDGSTKKKDSSFESSYLMDINEAPDLFHSKYRTDWFYEGLELFKIV